jgi:hypothetical protein
MRSPDLGSLDPMITATPGMAPVITGSFMVFPEAALHKAASGGIVKICISIAVFIDNPPVSHACK